MEDLSTVQSVIKNNLIYQREEEIGKMVESRTVKRKIIIKRISKVNSSIEKKSKFTSVNG